jgi:rubrerythrin
MVLTSIFIILAVGVLVIAVVIQPLYGVSTGAFNEVSRISEESLSAANQKHLDWLHDLEIEHAAGKIEQQDFIQQRAVLQQEVENLHSKIQLLQEDPAAKGDREIESMITNRRMERVERSAGFCVKCGTPLQRSDLFCPNCGLKLK